MKKSNKGFTLIELLAVIVLLGVLFMYAIPEVVGLVSRNRDKMYVADIKKLMSQAEYTVRASNTKIEKPDPDSCIIISLVYLDDSDFEEAPNKGEYDREASYVVIKNNDNGDLEYSATIVEKLKGGGYRGILLTKGEALNQDNAVQYVTNIKQSDIVTAEELKNGGESYINGRLKGNNETENYIASVQHVYNNPEMDDTASKGGSESPTIKATISSASGKDYNSLDALLTLTADDPDTPTSNLTVLISTTGYGEDAETYSYGDNNSFSHIFNFDKEPYNYQYGDDAIDVNIYITVKDPQKNEAKVTLLYTIHKNAAPAVDEEQSGFSRLPTDKANRPDSIFRLYVTDDIDDLQDLKVCLIEDPDETKECGEDDFKDWNTVFNRGRNEGSYHFNVDGCNLVGQEKRVLAVIKDKNGKTSSKEFTYKLANDGNPTITGFTLSSLAESFIGDGSNGNSLNAKVKVEGYDDVSSNEDIKLTISSSGTPTKTIEHFASGVDIDYTLSGDYDGVARTITVTLTDECGHSSSSSKTYPIYRNKPPVVSNVIVESDGFACKDGNICPLSDGNSKNAVIYFRVSDDLDSDDLDSKISVCISEKESDCAAGNTSNFKPYSEYSDGYYYTFSGSYDGSSKTVYVVAKDHNGALGTGTNQEPYKLYKNKLPEVTNFKVEAVPNDFTSDQALETKVLFNISDDLDDVSDLKYKIGAYDKNNSTIYYERNTLRTLGNYNELDGLSYTVGEYYENNELKRAFSYDGAIHKVVLTIYDSSSTTNGVQKEFDYQVYANQPPHIFTTMIQDKVIEGDDEDDEPIPDDPSEESDDNIESVVTDGISIVPMNEDCHANYICPYILKNEKATGEISGDCPGGSGTANYTVQYAKGAHGAFAEKSRRGGTKFTNKQVGAATPKYAGAMSQYNLPLGNTKWIFTGWQPDFNPCIAAEDADSNKTITYTAQWAEDENLNGIPDGSEGENATAEIIFDVEDDMDTVTGKELYICLAEEAENATSEPNKAKCEQKIKCDDATDIGDCIAQGKYFQYSKFIEKDEGTNWGRKFEFNNGKYDGSTKKLYVFALDSEGAISSASQTYVVYKNQAPEIVKREEQIDENGEVTAIKVPDVVSSIKPSIEKEFDEEGNEIASHTVKINSKKAAFNLEATDDFDRPVNLKVNVCYQCTANCGSEDRNVHCYDENDNDNVDNYVNYEESYDIEFPALDGYKGQKYKVYAKIRDSLGAIKDMNASGDTIEYQLYNDATPKIVSVDAVYNNKAQGINKVEESTEEDDDECAGGSGNAEYSVVYKKGDHGDFTENENDKTSYSDLQVGEMTPGYNGAITDYGNDISLPKAQSGWVFDKWSPNFKLCINAADADSSKTITYTAQWARDANNNGISDLEEPEPTGTTQGKWKDADTTNKPRLTISAVVDDPLDTYKICISQSEAESSCPDSSYVGKNSSGEGFSGDDLRSGVAYYVKDNPENLKYYIEDDATVTEYYVHIKDSYGKKVTTAIVGHEYTQCSLAEGTASSTVYNHSSGQQISAATCRGRCYFANQDDMPYKEVNGALYYDDGNDDENAELIPVLTADRIYDTSGIKGNYTKVLSYNDRFKTDTVCSTAEETEEKNCSYIDCFKNPNYSEGNDSTPKYMKAIGTTKRSMPRHETISETINGVTYTDEVYYYYLYDVSLDEEKNVAVLTRLPQKILATAYNEHPEDYEFSDDNTVYVRVMD